MTQEEEQLIVKEAKTNNESFVKLYDYYYPKILGYCFRRTLDLNLSKDLTSETFLKAFTGIGKYEWRGIPFSSWLFRIASNEMNMLGRKKKYNPDSLTILKESGIFEITDPASLNEEKNELEKQLQHSKDFMNVQQKLLLLPVKYQEVIALRYFEEKSIKEIAEILQIKEGTIKSLLSRGIEKLKHLVLNAT
ncbi:MAG: RNA polymerase sigma factor [Bacteroidota bacterium]|nr:RNA polymerase sigma factor [Bacteroidota bacterium]